MIGRLLENRKGCTCELPELEEGTMKDPKTLLNYEFEYVQELAPVTDMNGKIKLFHPEEKYNNVKNHKLLPVGTGPFCRFSINPKWTLVSGVYVFYIDDELRYIGQCLDFAQRFNIGYGTISPRCCYEGGQSTNCKMNKVVLAAYENGQKVDLYFYATHDYDRVEFDLIQHFKPMHNTARTGTYQVKSIDSHEKKLPKENNAMNVTRSNADGKSLTQDARDYIQRFFDMERSLGKKSVVLVSGDSEKDMGWSKRLPIVCQAMYSMMKSDDVVLHTTPSGKSSTIEIEYQL